MTDPEKIQELEHQLKELSAEFHNYVQSKQQEESRRLRAALMFAGGVILALGTFIWSEVIWPVIKAGKP